MNHALMLPVLLPLLGGAALLNPSEDRHRDAIVAQYKKENPLSGRFLVGDALAQMTTYHNYVLFSTTTIGEDKISTGYVGLVDVHSLDLANVPDLIRRKLDE